MKDLFEHTRVRNINKFVNVRLLCWRNILYLIPFLRSRGSCWELGMLASLLFAKLKSANTVYSLRFVCFRYFCFAPHIPTILCIFVNFYIIFLPSLTPHQECNEKLSDIKIKNSLKQECHYYTSICFTIKQPFSISVEK